MNEEAQPRPADRHDHVAKLVLVGIVMALLVAFILENTAQVQVSFVFVHARFSLIWVLLATNLLGFIAGYLLRGRLGVRGGRGRARR